MLPGLHEFVNRLWGLFRRRRLDREMTDELGFHQGLLREKLLRQGVPQLEVDGRHDGRLALQAAGRRACASCGSLGRRKTSFATSDFRRGCWPSRRVYCGRHSDTDGGVGANTAVFSLINGLLLGRFRASRRTAGCPSHG